MLHNKDVLRQVGQVTLGEVICTALMVGVFALLGRFSMRVLWGACIGAAVAVLNFLFLSMTVSRAADEAAAGNAERAKISVQISSVVRLFVLVGVYILLLSRHVFDPVALVLPLLLIRVSITMISFFRKDTKDGEKVQ